MDPSRDLAQIEAIALDILGDKDGAFKQFSIWLASNPQQARRAGPGRYVGAQGPARRSAVLGDLQREEMSLKGKK